MSNYIEYNNTMAFHPGYYIQELVENSGLTQEDFAKRLDTTPKNLSLLIRGEQSLSIDIAMKLARLLDTTVEFWLTMQSAYDTAIAELKSNHELQRERAIFKYFSYEYFAQHYHLPLEAQNIDDQIKFVRKVLQLSSLSILTKPNTIANCKLTTNTLTEREIISNNIMTQLGINQVLQSEAPKFTKTKIKDSINFLDALYLDKQFNQNILLNSHDNQLNRIADSLLASGIILASIPKFPGSTLKSATKKLGSKVMLLINTTPQEPVISLDIVYQELHNIAHGDYGITIAN